MTFLRCVLKACFAALENSSVLAPEQLSNPTQHSIPVFVGNRDCGPGHCITQRALRAQLNCYLFWFPLQLKKKAKLSTKIKHVPFPVGSIKYAWECPTIATLYPTPGSTLPPLIAAVAASIKIDQPTPLCPPYARPSTGLALRLHRIDS